MCESKETLILAYAETRYIARCYDICNGGCWKSSSLQVLGGLLVFERLLDKVCAQKAVSNDRQYYEVPYAISVMP